MPNKSIARTNSSPKINGNASRVKPSLKMKLLGAVLVVGLIVFGVVSFKPQAASGWSDIRALPPEVLNGSNAEIVEGAGLDVKQMKVLKISGGDSPFYVIDFKNAQLCGRSGCLYVGYSQSGNSLFRLLLNPKLPSAANLFAASEKVNGYPCLDVTQPSNNIGRLQVGKFCYDGNSFVPFNSVVSVEEKKEK